MSLRLETCKEDLVKAEEEQTAALVYSAEVEALRSKLSAKEQKVHDLSSELSQRERELRIKDRTRYGSSHGQTFCKRCSKFEILAS